MNPYQTTYSRDYPVKEPKETTAHRYVATSLGGGGGGGKDIIVDDSN